MSTFTSAPLPWKFILKYLNFGRIIRCHLHFQFLKIWFSKFASEGKRMIWISVAVLKKINWLAVLNKIHRSILFFSKLSFCSIPHWLKVLENKRGSNTIFLHFLKPVQFLARFCYQNFFLKSFCSVLIPVVSFRRSEIKVATFCWMCLLVAE